MAKQPLANSFIEFNLSRDNEQRMGKRFLGKKTNNGPHMMASFQKVTPVAVRVSVVRNAVIVAVCFAALCGAGYADDPTVWLAGRDLEKAKMMAVSSGVVDSPLRQHIQRLSHSQRVAVFVDRRVDPTHEASYSAKDLTWDQLAFRVAKVYEVGVCRLDDLYYFGPPETAASLPILYQQLKEQLKTNRKQQKVNLRKPSPVAIGHLANPREVLQQLAAENGVEISGLDAIHFDQWPQLELPELPIVQQMALLVVGFDCWLEFSVDGKEMRIIPYPELKSGRRMIKAIGQARDFVRQLQPQFSDCKLTAVGRTIDAAGPIQSLAKLASAVAGMQKAKTAEVSNQRFSLIDTTSKRGAILQALANEMQLKIVASEAATADLEERITVNVKDATADEIIADVLKGSSLKFRIVGRELFVEKN